MNQVNDLSLIEKAAVRLAFYGAAKLEAKSSATQVAVLAQLKTAFKAINLSAPPAIADVMLAIISFLKALANITQTHTVQAVEVLFGDIYSAFTTGSVSFSTVWADVRNLFSGAASGQVDPKDVTTDVDLFISSLCTLVAWGLSKLSGNALDVANASIANIIAGLDTADTVTDQDALTEIFNILDASADLSNNPAVVNVEKFLKSVFTVLTGSENKFEEFISAIRLTIQAKKAVKAQ